MNTHHPPSHSPRVIRFSLSTPPRLPPLALMVLGAVLAGCTTQASSPTVIPTSPTQPEPTATLRLPTPTPNPTRTKFVNPLIYDIPEMYQVTVETVQFSTLTEPPETLAMDIFYPPDRQVDRLLPAVILPNAFQRHGKLFSVSGHVIAGFFEGWGRIIAANGLIAVTYDTTLYPNDLEAVVKHVQENSTKLGIDSNRLGLFAESSNTVPEGSFAYQENREYLKFVVFYYGNAEMPDSPARQATDAFCAEYGCYSAELPVIKRLRTDLPVLLIRPGYDTEANLADIDYFIRIATEQGVPITLIRFDEGRHGFDASDSSFGEVRTKGIEIIKQTIEFMKSRAFAP